MEEKSIVAYNAWDEFYKTPFGAVKAGEEIRVRIRVLREANPSGAVLKLRRDGESAERTVELLPDKEQDSTYTGAFRLKKRGSGFTGLKFPCRKDFCLWGRAKTQRRRWRIFYRSGS